MNECMNAFLLFPNKKKVIFFFFLRKCAAEEKKNIEGNV